ncbi:MAG: aldo/keto reductase [Cytophagales bacterium]|nr:aldo/keto reductase [Armatimonadota bacterium]
MNEQTPAARSGTFRIAGELEVFRLGYGAMQITGPGIWGAPRDHEESLRVLRRCPELGINLIDTADSYGPHISEELIAEALYPYADGLVIATKAGLTRTGPNQWPVNGDPAYLRQCLDGSLKRLKRDAIDLYQLHRIDDKFPLEDQVGVFAEAQKAGKIRFIGLSEVTTDQLAAAQKVAPISTVQNRYNVADREWESVVEACEAQNIGFLPWFPLATGNLAKPGGPLDMMAKKRDVTPSQVALAWLLHRSPVMLPIPGTSSVQHLEENMRGASLRLSDSEMAELNNAKGE